MDVSRKDDVSPGNVPLNLNEEVMESAVGQPVGKKARVERERDVVVKRERREGDEAIEVAMDNPILAAKRLPEVVQSTSTRQAAYLDQSGDSINPDEGVDLRGSLPLKDEKKALIDREVNKLNSSLPGNNWFSNSPAAAFVMMILQEIGKIYSDNIITLAEFRAKIGMKIYDLGVAISQLKKESAEVQARQHETEAMQNFGNAAIAGVSIAATTAAVGKAKEEAALTDSGKERVEAENKLNIAMEEKKAGKGLEATDVGSPERAALEKQQDEKIAKLQEDLAKKKSSETEERRQLFQTKHQVVQLEGEVAKGALGGTLDMVKADYDRQKGSIEAAEQMNQTQLALYNKMDEATKKLVDQKMPEMDKLLQQIKEISSAAVSQGGRG